MKGLPLRSCLIITSAMVLELLPFHSSKSLISKKLFPMIISHLYLISTIDFQVGFMSDIEIYGSGWHR